jgi:hypothetical protein
MNLFFTAMIILYTYEIYIHGNDENKVIYLSLLIVSNIYPVAYECVQAYKIGLVEYIKTNVLDTIYYGCTIANVVIQLK